MGMAEEFRQHMDKRRHGGEGPTEQVRTAGGPERRMADLISRFMKVDVTGREGESWAHQEFSEPSLSYSVRCTEALKQYVSVRDRFLSGHKLSDRLAAELDGKAAMCLMQPLGSVRFSYAGDYKTKAYLPGTGAETVPFDVVEDDPVEMSLQHLDMPDRQYLEGEISRVRGLLEKAHDVKGDDAMRSLTDSLVQAGLDNTPELDFEPEHMLDEDGVFHIENLAQGMDQLAFARKMGLSDNPDGRLARMEQKAASIAAVACEEALPEECLAIIREHGTTYEYLGEGAWFASFYGLIDHAASERIMNRLQDGPGQGLYEGECSMERDGGRKKNEGLSTYYKERMRASEMVLAQSESGEGREARQEAVLE